MRQETLEEAELKEKEFYNYMAKQDSWKSTGLIIQEFIKLKLKEQQERSYSEEEAIDLLKAYKLHSGANEITNIKEGYKNLSFVLTERYTTAADMYKLMLKLNTEQETSGDFDILNSNIHDTLSQYDLFFHLNPQFFTGREDMIFELNVDIVMNNDCKLDNKDLVKEHILGTVLKEIQSHFDVYYRKHNDSNIAVVKHYFRNY